MVGAQQTSKSGSASFLSRHVSMMLDAGRGPDMAVRRRTNKRLKYIIAVVLLVTLLLGWRLFYLQVFRADELANVADSFRSTSYIQQAKRGDIFDSKGTLLATSVPKYNVRADQVALQNYVEYGKDKDGETDTDIILGVGPARAAQKLAPILGIEEATLGGMLRGENQDNQWTLIASGLSSAEWEKVSDLGIHGIYSERYMEREYPGGTTAGSLLGYVSQTAEDSSVQGRAGVELQMNSILAGQDGSTSVQVGPNGTEFPDSEKVDVETVDGGDVHLTINADLQRVAEEAIDTAVQKAGGEWGSAVALEIDTGRVLALAETNSPDPGSLDEDSLADWGTRSISAVYEPGSVGKLITVASAIDQGKVTPTSTFTVASTIQMPNGQSISDTSSHATEDMTVAGIIAQSLNTGTVQIGDLINDKTRFGYIQRFGWGSKTGIDLPSEESGILRPYQEWGDRDHYTTMFGQGIAVTTLQVAQMAAVFGQDGVLIPPRIIDGYDDESGIYIPTVMGESRQVISKETAQQVLNIMQGVTQPRGYAHRTANVPGYNVAGKTGTAENAGDSGALTDRAGTFVGLVPAEDPKIAVAVVVYVRNGSTSGSADAAPVFAEIGKFAMRDMGVQPSTVPLYDYPWYPYESEE